MLNCWAIEPTSVLQTTFATQTFKHTPMRHLAAYEQKKEMYKNIFLEISACKNIRKASEKQGSFIAQGANQMKFCNSRFFEINAKLNTL